MDTVDGSHPRPSTRSTGSPGSDRSERSV